VIRPSTPARQLPTHTRSPATDQHTRCRPRHAARLAALARSGSRCDSTQYTSSSASHTHSLTCHRPTHALPSAPRRTPRRASSQRKSTRLDPVHLLVGFPHTLAHLPHRPTHALPSAPRRTPRHASSQLQSTRLDPVHQPVSVPHTLAHLLIYEQIQTNSTTVGSTQTSMY